MDGKKSFFMKILLYIKKLFTIRYTFIPIYAKMLWNCGLKEQVRMKKNGFMSGERNGAVKGWRNRNRYFCHIKY